jgi:hypothetical protein
MSFDDLIKNGKCCITDKPLRDCKHFNAVQINKKAKWKYPVWGNLTYNAQNMALAFVHDDCIDPDGNIIGEIKYAIEATETEIIYHPISELEA